MTLLPHNSIGEVRNLDTGAFLVDSNHDFGRSCFALAICLLETTRHRVSNNLRAYVSTFYWHNLVVIDARHDLILTTTAFVYWITITFVHHLSHADLEASSFCCLLFRNNLLVLDFQGYLWKSRISFTRIVGAALASYWRININRLLTD